MRNNPKQSRANQSVDDISEATTQLLDSDDQSKFTTNHIAVRAGLSIGTLYRYFPDKNAILRYIVRREIEQTSARILNMIETSGANSAQTLIEDVIKESMTAFNGKHRVRRNFRKMAQDVPELVDEMAQLRLCITRSLNERLVELEPEKFVPKADQLLSAACKVFKSATFELDQQPSLDSSAIVFRAKFAASLLETLSEKRTGSAKPKP